MMRMKNLLFILLFTLSLGCQKVKMDRTVVAVYLELPNSPDPLEFDYIENHIGFSSVNLTLVSVYEDKVTGRAAKDWSHSIDFKEWTFTIRNNLKFTDGKPVTPEAIAKSLNRMLYLKKKTNSNSGLLEFLKGYEKSQTASDNIEGIVVARDQIKLSFVKPMPDLLYKISFGIYGITSYKNFDHNNGNWLSDKPPITSGAYKIVTNTTSDFQIALRDDFPRDLLPSNPIENFKMKSISQINSPEDLKDVDIVFTEKGSVKVTDEFVFKSVTLDSKIFYVEILNKNHPWLSIKKNRQYLRNLFLEKLERQGYKVERSFLPLSMKGISEYRVPSMEFMKINSEFTVQALKSSKPIQNSANKISLSGYVVNTLKEIAEKTDVVFDAKENDYDIAFRSTGINLDLPLEDIKFMFLSKQGICLPDETGEIHKELVKINPDLSKINELIWDDAIVWPIGHMGAGFWIRKNGKILDESLSLISESFDLQSISLKD